MNRLVSIGPLIRSQVAALLPALVLAGCGAPAPAGPKASPAQRAPSARAIAATDAGAKPPQAGAAADDPPLRACRKGTADHAKASAAVDALEAHLSALRPEADATPVVAELTSVLAMPCFALAEGDTPNFGELAFDSPFALQRWWEAGGESWLRHYLELGDGGGTPNAPIWSWVAPTPRRSLTRETKDAGPLAPLLCPARDDACGRETSGWRLRATRAFDAHARARRHAEAAAIDDPLEHCRRKAAGAPAPERYDAWRECLDETTLRVDELPLGHFRAPKDGWLVLRGRRGHHAFCDEVRAYDLATGAAWTHGTCSNLALRSDGSVDRAATNAARVPKTTLGRLPLDALREAALVTILSPRADHDVVRDGYGRALPPDVTPMRAAASLHGLSLSGSYGSNQTTLQWSWIVKGVSIATGELTYPEHHDDAVRDHAIALLRIAEAALAPLGANDCIPAAPPTLPGKDARPFDGVRARICAPGR